jgi:hypothetical protein
MDSEDTDFPLFANLPDNDPDVIAAVSESKRTLPLFLDLAASGGFSSTRCAVKVPFLDRSATAEPALVCTSATESEFPGNRICHLWLIVTSVLEDLVFCSVFEAPDELQLKPGTSFVVTRESIEDWMIYQGGEVLGGYSLRVIRNRLGVEARKKFDAHSGIVQFKEVMP